MNIDKFACIPYPVDGASDARCCQSLLYIVKIVYMQTKTGCLKKPSLCSDHVHFSPHDP